MKTFHVLVTTSTGHHDYTEIALHSFDVHASAIDRFGVCKVSVRSA